MNRRLWSILALLLLGVAVTPSVVAQQTIGYFAFDVTGPNQAEFDVTNVTGINSFISPDGNPVTTSVSFSTLTLTVDFASGPNESFDSTYFTLDADGISLDGTALSQLIGQPTGFEGAIGATLTGDFSPTTLTLMDGTMVNIEPGFSSTITDLNGLQDGDLALVTATDVPPTVPVGPPTIPEPEPLVLVGTAMAALAGVRRRWVIPAFAMAARNLTCAIALVVLALVSTAAQAQVKLAVYTVPSSGLAGFNSVTTTGSGFPGRSAPSAVTVTFSSTCGGAAAATVQPTAINPVAGTTDRVAFPIPAGLTTGNYFVSISGSNTGGTSYSSSTCSQVQVTATTTTLAACVPTSSLAVTVGSNVTAYVPFGYWDGGDTGIEQVPLEGTATAQNFPTPGIVNSCASNSVTGEVVCTENTNNVDLISGSTLTTITSGSNQYTSFSGGECENCGVAINPSNNTAVIGMGVSGASSGSGVQVLNLTGTPTFNAPFAMTDAVSEDISIDSGRNLILSPGEGGSYTLMQIGSGNTLTEYSNFIGGTLDSAAEDCTTGIALSADEFTDNIYITDLTQAAFTPASVPGSPGTWTAPGQFFELNDANYSAGTSGISSAPGTGHLAVVTGEFGGSSYSALLLPSTSGTGTPTLADHAYVPYMPNTPDGYYFSAGYDPHTLTAYTSPNTGKAYAVFVDYALGYPSYLGVVDLACVLALPRQADGITVNADTTPCTRYVAVP